MSLKLEVGKFYKARNGMKAKIVLDEREHGNTDTSLPLYVLYYTNNSSEFVQMRQWLNKFGKYGSLSEEELELTEEWHDEPRKVSPDELKPGDVVNIQVEGDRIEIYEPPKNNLVGNIDGGFPTDSQGMEFAKKLEGLMMEYKISKIDVSWKKDFTQEIKNDS